MAVLKKNIRFASSNDFENHFFPKFAANRKKCNQANNEMEDPLKMTKKVIKASMLKIKKQISM